MLIWAINSISSAFDLIIITSFFNRRLESHRKNILSQLSPIILWAVMTIVSSLFSGTPLVPITILAGFVFYSFTYKGSRVLSAVIVFLAMLLAELISGILLMGIHNGNLYDIQSNPLFYMQGAILSKLIMFIELNIVNLFKENDPSLVNKKTAFSLSMIILSSIVSVYFVAMYVYNTENIISNIVALCVALIVVISFICTFNVFNTIIADQREKSHFEYEREHYENLVEFYMQQQKHQQEIRKLNHDMKNVLIGVLGAIDNKGDKASLIINEYLNQCVSFQNDFGNDSVSAVILAKKNIAESKNIVFEQQVILGDKKINDIDICILLGNMLDNAIESCELVEDETRRKISIKIRLVANAMYISCKNSCVETELNLHTRKSDKINHGIGTRSMTSIVDKYCGYIKFDCSNNEFTCETILPNEYNESSLGN